MSCAMLSPESFCDSFSWKLDKGCRLVSRPDGTQDSKSARTQHGFGAKPVEQSRGVEPFRTLEDCAATKLTTVAVRQLPAHSRNSLNIKDRIVKSALWTLWCCSRCLRLEFPRRRRWESS